MEGPIMVPMVPYISQRLHVTDPAWRGRACSIANLAMVLAHFKKWDKAVIDPLIEEGLSMNGFDERVGWTHEAIVRMARNHGVLAYRQEWRTRNPEYQRNFDAEGMTKLKSNIWKGRPIIVSVKNKFDGDRGFHTVTLCGVNTINTGFLYHDPDAESEEEGAFQEVDFETFRKGWRRLAIFFE